MERAVSFITIVICFLMGTLDGKGTNPARDAQSVAGITNPTVQPDTVIGSRTHGRTMDYRKEKADACLYLAEEDERSGHVADALHNYLTAIYELEILRDSLRIADTEVKIGSLFRHEGMFGKALEYYRSAELTYLRSGVVNAHPALLMQIGKTHFALEEYPEALQNFQRAAAIYSDNSIDSSWVLACYEQVKCLNALEEYNRSLGMNLVILDHFRREGDKNQEVIALNNAGISSKNLGKLADALNYFKEAGSLETEIYGFTRPGTLVNQAIVYQNMGNDNMALNKLNEAAHRVGRLKDESRTAEYYHLTALVYFNLKDFHNALIYNNLSINHAKQNRNALVLEKAYLLASRIYDSLYDYEASMINFQEHLDIKDSIRRQKILAEQNLSSAKLRAEEISRETENLWASEEISYLELQRLKLDSANRQQELEILYKTDSIQRITIQNQELENQRVRQALLLKEEQMFSARKANEADSLRRVEEKNALELERQQLIRKQQESKIILLDRENKITTLEIKKVKTRNKWLIAFGFLALIIIYLVYRGLTYAKKTNKILLVQKNEIERQKDEIDYERKRSDNLLLNILPEETAEELKEKGSATPRHYEMVSVLFTDFKGFTNIAEKLTPQELVAELDHCFLEFDKIIDNHNLEKIKTIGDAYMCAGGIPVANTSNPADVVRAGLEIKQFMEEMKQAREAIGQPYWELRIGIHTGPVIAGVVGKNKFAYDIWGDAVNTASRMESSGIPGKVNISGTTHELVKETFTCTYRGKIQAKNKGEIDMYIVEREN